MKISDHLLDQAKLIANRGRRPRGTDLKRATSTVYYALFHAVAKECADSLAGSGSRLSPAWTRIYRALNHSKAKSEFKKISQAGKNRSLLQLAASFNDLQEARHYADYDPGPSKLSRFELIAQIELTQTIIVNLSKIPQDELRDLATKLLLQERQ